MLALVPVKRLTLAKQRLRSVLSEQECGMLSLAMTQDVLNSLRQSSCIDRILVCAGDHQLLEMAGELGADVVLETDLGLTGLNKVVNAVASDLYAQGESSILVSHSDIPGLMPDDVDRICTELKQSEVVICPDAHDQGSNLIAWRLGSGFSPRYGTNSFHKHCQQAENKGLSLSVIKRESATLDLDRPIDLWNFMQASHRFDKTRTLMQLQQFSLEKKLAEAATGADIKGVSNHVTI